MCHVTDTTPICGCLLSQCYDLMWPTCPQDLMRLALAIPEI